MFRELNAAGQGYRSWICPWVVTGRDVWPAWAGPFASTTAGLPRDSGVKGPAPSRHGRTISERARRLRQEVIKLTNTAQATAGAGGRQQTVTLRPRSPVRAAVLSLVTFSLYGFWWWWDVNRRLKALGQPAHPWLALAAVTVGWAAVVPPFRSVQRTAVMIGAAERRTGAASTVNPSLAVTIAAVAAAGAIAWVATSLAALSAGIFIGMAWALIAMVFVGYLQRELNRAAG